jgi:CheY-like chemotaxis protein
MGFAETVRTMSTILLRRVLIVEDTPSDARQSIVVVKKLGAQEVTALDNIASAMLLLQDVVEGKLPPPDLILLDLSFPKESGFEVLRFWKLHPQLKGIRIVVWTVMGETEQKLCNFFGVDRVIAKWAGPKELEETLRAYTDDTDSAIS